MTDPKYNSCWFVVCCVASSNNKCRFYDNEESGIGRCDHAKRGDGLFSGLDVCKNRDAIEHRYNTGLDNIE